MKPALGPILCDGCGQIASPEHIAARVRRLELATRFRPIHVGILFVAMAPPALVEEDFYNVENPGAAADRFLTALAIASPEAGRPGAADSVEAATARLNKFQHRGHYLSYVYECPQVANSEDGETRLEQLPRHLSTFVTRIRFNYRPKFVAPLGAEMTPLVERLREAGLADLLLLGNGAPLAVPEPGNVAAEARFQEALAEKTRGSSSAAMV